MEYEEETRMTETTDEHRPEPGRTNARSRPAVSLDWGFRILLVLCAVPALLNAFALLAVFAHDPPGLIRALAWSLPPALACAVLALPWRLSLARWWGKVLVLLAACVAAHQVYSTFGSFQGWRGSTGVFVFCGLVLAAGAASFLLYLRPTRQRAWPIALGLVPVLACFVFGSGDPQWSRWIFVWQVHYSPWKRDAGNLPTNRHDPRLTRPKYTEWDARGRPVRAWTHPGGELLRTEYYPDGTKRMERLYAEDQFVTFWYANGQREYEYDRQTRRRRAWDPNGTPRQGQVATTFPGTDKVQTLEEYDDGYCVGVHRFWHTGGARLMREVHYRDGRTHGVTRAWNSVGTLTLEEYYIEGYRQGPPRRFRDDGSLDWEETYAHGVLQGARKTYPRPTPGGRESRKETNDEPSVR
jgi:antitoxin component YwqK of YwqJK toxin-antitoxin module